MCQENHILNFKIINYRKYILKKNKHQYLHIGSVQIEVKYLFKQGICIGMDEADP